MATMLLTIRKQKDKMERHLLVLACASIVFGFQSLFPNSLHAQESTRESCTSIMVGRQASADGSVITSHTCDGRYRTWMSVEPAADHKRGAVHTVRKGTMHTAYRDDTTGVVVSAFVPQARHTYAYLNTAYPCLNEHQLAIGETTFGGPDTLRNTTGAFQIEELERIALMRCTTAREAIHLIADLIAKYGYGDGGECITIADRHEVWQMEILGEGKTRTGGIWAARRVPDGHVAVSANIARIGRLERQDTVNFLCSDNIEAVALEHGLWDGQGEFVFWKAFNDSYAQGKNFREREWYILNTLAPSLNLNMDAPELPFSVRPDAKVDVQTVMELLRSTYEGTDLDMTRNLLTTRKNKDGGMDTIISPVANPWMTGTMLQTLNMLKPGTVEFRRTVSVAWCSYSFVAQLRDWLPDEVGGICWMAVDNPGQSPRIPIFCGTTELPEAYSMCGQKGYNPDAVLWQFRKANKLATVQWQTTRRQHTNAVLRLEHENIEGLDNLEKKVIRSTKSKQRAKLLNAYTQRAYGDAVGQWRRMEEAYWQRFGMGF